MICGFWTVVGLCLLFGAMGSPRGSVAFVSYLGLTITCAAVVGAIATAYGDWRLLAIAGPIVIVIFLATYMRVDCYEERWTKHWNDETFKYEQIELAFGDWGDRIEYHDTYRRFPTRHIYRVVETYDSEHVPWWMPVKTMRGPIADGHIHGAWESETRGKTLGWTTDRIWYWYGDEISVGDWHLREKR